MVSVKKVNSPEELEISHEIRFKVFVYEQKVPAEDELDQYEEESMHFLAHINNVPCGTARYRITPQGVKLERFAVLNGYRSKGIGSALVEAVLKDIKTNPLAEGKPLYLHSQVDAIPLYIKFGFKKTGELFDECGIMHSKMIKAAL